MRIDLHTHSRASDGTQTAARAGARRPRRPGSTCSRSPTTTPRRLGRGRPTAAPEIGRRRWSAAWRSAPGTGGLGRAPARLPARPDVPARWSRGWATHPRRPRARGSRRSWTGSASSASTSTEPTTYAGPRAAPRRPGVRTSPTRWSTVGVVPDRDEAFARLPEPGAARRTSTGTPPPLEELIALVDGAGGVDRRRAPVGPARPRRPDEGERARAELRGRRADRHRGRPPGPHARRPRERCARSPATSASSSPAPATTTAPARSTTSSAATRPTPTELRAAARARPRRPRRPPGARRPGWWTA